MQTMTVKKVPMLVWVVIPAMLAFVIVALWWKFGGKPEPAMPSPVEKSTIDAKTPEKSREEPGHLKVHQKPVRLTPLQSPRPTPPQPQPGTPKGAPKTSTADAAAKPAATTEPAAPDVTPGIRPSLLAVRSRPAGCRVEIDGVDVFDRTPIERMVLEPAAEYEVTVLCPGYSVESKRINCLPGDWITLDFAPPVKPALKAPRKPKAKLGALRLDTVPWSEVFYKKRKLGITPLLDVKLPAGTHKLKAINAGRGLEKTIKVTIKAGRTTTLKVGLSE
jgi:serine/threonine-protein kinase